jgi:group I intron endonuclease
MVYIYKITNILNNKVYVGKTEQEPKTRWRQHFVGMGNGKKMPIHLALKKYGYKNFQFEIVYVCFDNKDAIHAEGYFINTFTSIAPYGYNVHLTTGHMKDNPYLIAGTNNLAAVQSIPSETTQVEYNLGKRTRYPIELWNDIKKLYSNGKTIKEIKIFLNIEIPNRTMLSKLKALGCDTSSKTRNKIRGNGKYIIPQSEQLNIIDDFKSGLTPVQLEKKYKRAARTVKNILVTANLYVSLDKKICRTYE